MNQANKISMPNLMATPHGLAKELDGLKLTLSIINLACFILILTMVILMSLGMYLDHFNVVPYVADGSAYGCQPRVIPADLVKEHGA